MQDEVNQKSKKEDEEEIRENILAYISAIQDIYDSLNGRKANRQAVLKSENNNKPRPP